MTDAERDALVERMAEAAVDAGLWPGAWAGGAALGHGYPGQVTPPMPEPERYEWRRRMRAALAEAEKTVRADEREAASARVLDTAAPAYLDATQGGWWAEFAPMFAESARGDA